MLLTTVFYAFYVIYVIYIENLKLRVTLQPCLEPVLSGLRIFLQIWRNFDKSAISEEIWLKSQDVF